MQKIFWMRRSGINTLGDMAANMFMFLVPISPTDNPWLVLPQIYRKMHFHKLNMNPWTYVQRNVEWTNLLTGSNHLVSGLKQLVLYGPSVVTFCTVPPQHE